MRRSIVQFQYGEDGIDVLNSSFLKEFGFAARNSERITQQQRPAAALAASKVAKLEPLEKEAAKMNRCSVCNTNASELFCCAGSSVSL